MPDEQEKLRQEIEILRLRKEKETLLAQVEGKSDTTSTLGEISAAIKAGTDVVTSTTKLVDSVDTLYRRFEGASQFKERHRTLELLVINATKRRLIWEDAFFDSGTTFAGPLPLNVLPCKGEYAEEGAGLWAVANTSGSFLTGVSGGGKWRIEGTPFSLVIGFTNPQFGEYKTAIGIASRFANARAGYDAAENVHAKQYDAFGFVTRVYPDHPKLSPHRRFVYCIAESEGAVSPAKGDRIGPGQALSPGDYLLSQNGNYALLYQSDGNLVVYSLTELRNAVWSSGTAQRNAFRCAITAAGTLSVFESEGRAVWSTPRPAPDGTLVMQDDGNLVLYTPNGQARWDSKGFCK